MQFTSLRSIRGAVPLLTPTELKPGLQFFYPKWVQISFRLLILCLFGSCSFMVSCSTSKSAVKPTDEVSLMHEAIESAVPAPPPSVVHVESLKDFLKTRLGSNFHNRSEWAASDCPPVPLPHRVWKSIGQVNNVTIHHSETPSFDPVARIRSIYVDHTKVGSRLDAPDVGYHFFVDATGQVWEGRDSTIQGTHVASYPPGHNNPGNIGICGLGSYLSQEPSQAMVNSIVNLTLLLSEYYGRGLVVRGHRDWGGINGLSQTPTDCPGRLESAVVLASSKMNERNNQLQTSSSSKMAFTTQAQQARSLSRDEKVTQYIRILNARDEAARQTR